MSARPACRARGDHGSATIWVLASCALLLVIAGVVMIRTLAVLARHRVESAADLAALAAAGRIGVSADECAAASEIARDNATWVTSCRVSLAAGGRSGSVTVQVRATVHLQLVGARAVSASARAGRLPG